MRVLYDSYRGTEGRIRRCSVVKYVLGTIALVVGSWWAIVGVLMILMSEDLLDGRAGLVCIVFGGIFPLLAAVFLIRAGARGQQRLTRLRGLVGLSRLKPDFLHADIATSMSLTPEQTEALLQDAESLGILEDATAPRPTETEPQTPGDDRLVGMVLNRTYTLQRRIGSGATGAVYHAAHVRTGRPYAVKVLHADSALTSEALKRFEREAAAASALGHPNIAAVHDVDKTPDGLHYLVMDLLRGETLEARLEQIGSLEWAHALPVALALCGALDAAHGAGLLHRDLKPANVFLAREADGSDRTVLLDFGLAKPMDATATKVTASGAAVGTPLYMSPEQAKGTDQDERSDIYGLAAVLFEMVTGTPPFFDKTLAMVYRRLLTEDVPSASEIAPGPVPDGLDAVLVQALAKERDDRFASVGALAEALRALPAVATVLY